MIHSKQRTIQNLVAYIILTIGGFLCLYPLIFTILAGFFSAEEFYLKLNEMSLFPIPEKFVLDNYIAIFSSTSELGMYFINSCIRTVYSTVCAVIVSFLAGYCFARLRFRGRKFWFLFLMTFLA